MTDPAQARERIAAILKDLRELETDCESDRMIDSAWAADVVRRTLSTLTAQASSGEASRFEKNGIAAGERVVCVDVPHLLGRVTRCGEDGVQVRWDDGRDGDLVWDCTVAYNAFRLQVVRGEASQGRIAELVGRLRKCAGMLRTQYPAQANADSPHREHCVDVHHQGCNMYQSIRAMEDAAFSLGESAALRVKLQQLTNAIAHGADISGWHCEQIVALATAHAEDSGIVDREVLKREAAEMKLEAAEAEIARLGATPVRTGCDECLEARRVLQAKLEAAEQALRKYGKHPSTCNKWWHHQIEGSILQNNKHCTCGLDALLASASRGEG